MNEVGRGGKSRPIRLAVKAVLKQSVSALVSRHQPLALCLGSAAEYMALKWTDKGSDRLKRTKLL